MGALFAMMGLNSWFFGRIDLQASVISISLVVFYLLWRMVSICRVFFAFGNKIHPVKKIDGFNFSVSFRIAFKRTLPTAEHTLEMVMQPSKSLGKSVDIFTGVAFSYGLPIFYFTLALEFMTGVLLFRACFRI
jgi:hypothetical protein